MSQNYFQIILDLIFPKDTVQLNSVQDFGYKDIQDLGIYVWVATEYNDPSIYDLIHKVKVGGQFAYAQELSQILVERTKYNFDFYKKILIVPVPSDPKRLLEKSFSLSSMLAKDLTQKLNLELPADQELKAGLEFCDLLYKKENTIKQSYLNREKRLTNLNDKIDIYGTKTNVANFEEVWIIDDITTTGATLYECQKVIQQKHPFVEVQLLALASN